MTSLSYTAANHTYDNIGAGIAMRFSVFQLYATADRIPLSWNKIVNDKSTVVLPSNWNIVDLRFGMNLVFGLHRKKTKAEASDNTAEPVTTEEPADIQNTEINK